MISAAITSVYFSHDGQCILVSSDDDTVRLLDKNTGELLGEYVCEFMKFISRLIL